MNLSKKIALAGVLVASSSVAVAGEFSANVALTTDYVWRGISQTNEDPAIQGGFDFAHESGFYIGTWGSNVDFGGDEHMELDWYAGWGGDVGAIGVDVGVIRYTYYDDTDVDFTEIYLGGSYEFFSAKVSHDGDNENTYWEAGVEFGLPNDITLAAHVGKYDWDTGPDPVDYSIGVSKDIGGFGFDLSYYDTDSDGDDAYGDLGDGRVVFTVSKSM